MKYTNWMRWLSAGAVATSLAACAAEIDDVSAPGAGEDEAPEIVAFGKEDNYLSKSSQEYAVEGEVTIVLDAADKALPEEQKLAKVQRLIPFKQIAIGWFLNSYITSKSDKDANKDYGDFHSLTKNGSYEELAIRPMGDGVTYAFTVRQELGGPNDLLKGNRLPVVTGADGKMTFELKVGKTTNEEIQRLEINDEWYRKAPWSSFDPSKLDPSQLETLTFAIKAEPRSMDGFVDAARLFADGKVTIAIYFGWDYHSEYHLKHSKEIYDWLVSKGYKAPAAYDALTRKSAPLTRSIQAGGKPVQVEVTLHWGKPGSETDPDTAAGGKALEEDMRADLATKEVVIFSGHSGPFYGFALANWRKTDEGDLDDSEIAGLTLPDFYQVVLAEGCETYALGQAFFMNPAKSSRTNIDIITTTTYSNAAQADGLMDFISAVAGADSKGNYTATTYGQLMEKLDGNSWSPAMYGVHGIDDNPHLKPFADKSRFCSKCAVDADCGGSNQCVKLGASKVCSAACTADDGCPGGYTCQITAYGLSVTGRVCAPLNSKCSEPPPVAATLVLNEVLADPPTGATGDANGDGKTDSAQDEFIELVNPGSTPLNVGGWTVADGAKVRFTFAQGVTIPARAAAVIFGGGKLPASTSTVKFFAATAGLGLGNAGDTVILRNAAGKVMDKMTYGAEGGKDRSLVRGKETDVTSAFAAHPGGPQNKVVCSPGTKVDGTGF